MLLRRIKLRDPAKMDKYLLMTIVNFNFNNSLKQNMKMKNMNEYELDHTSFICNKKNVGKKH